MSHVKQTENSNRESICNRSTAIALNHVRSPTRERLQREWACEHVVCARMKRNGRARFHSCATHLNFIQRSARAFAPLYVRAVPILSLERGICLPSKPRNYESQRDCISRFPRISNASETPVYSCLIQYGDILSRRHREREREINKNKLLIIIINYG